MSTSQTPSQACCTVPPIVTTGYEAKGKYITVNGMKTYVTGAPDAKYAIFVIMDIFGFFPQTLQGADILAHSNHSKKFQVYIPDFFDGKPADISWYPPDNDEKGKKLGEFFNTTAAPPKTLERIPKTLEELKSGPAKTVENWGILGYCWGGKIANLSSQEGTSFKAGAAVHPAMIDPADAEKIAIPFALLPSGDEDKDAVSKWDQNLKQKHIVEWYPDQVHGWLAARANLEDENVKKAYEKGYKTLGIWFDQYL